MKLEFRYRTNLRLGGDEWTNHRIEAWHDGEKLGHLTIAFIERETFDREFPDLDAYIRELKGYSEITDYLRELHAEKFQRFEQFHVETAHVAYVIVEDEHWRKGIATQLYLEGARWITERHGLQLASSDLQTPPAAALWEKLVADPDVPTVKLDDGRWALDGFQGLGTKFQALGNA